MSANEITMPVRCAACGLFTYDPHSVDKQLVCPSCVRQANEDVIPQGFRKMTGEEADAFDGSASLLVFDCADRHISRWFPVSYSQWGWKVVQRDTLGQIVESLRLASDEHGMDAEEGRFIVVVPIDADDLTPLLRESIYAIEAQDILTEVREARANLRLL